MRKLVDKFHEKSISFNPRFVSGFAKHDIAKGVQYIDTVIRCAQQSFPKGLVYENPEICTPEKAFQVFNEDYKNDKKYIYDFARNDFYLIQLNFSFDGGKFPIYLYMPFTDETGVIYIRDKPFYIKPAMADPLISVSGEGLFLPLNQTNMTTRARSHFINKEDRILQVKIYETTIHHSLREIQAKDNKESKMRITCNAHYLFCEEGYKPTFERFKAIVQAGYADKINHTNYPKDEWTIYSSATNPDTAIQITEDGANKPHNVLLAVKKSGITRDVESVIGAFFFILDLLPDIDDIENLEDHAWWVIKMGKIILSNDVDQRILFRKMNEHYKTVKTYVDPMAIDLMKAHDVYIEDIYGYLEWGISNYDAYRNRPESDQATMYGKYLMVNRYVFKPIREAIFTAIYELRQKDESKLTLKDVRAKLRGRLRPDLITRINSNCPNVSAVISSTDSKLLKMGLEIVPQDNMRAKKMNKTPKMLRNNRWRFNASFIDAGGFNSMSKHEPVGKDIGGTNINIDLDGRIRPQTGFDDLMEKTKRNIRID